MKKRLQRLFTVGLSLLLPVVANAQDFSRPEATVLVWLRFFEWIVWAVIAGVFLWGFMHLGSRDKAKPVTIIVMAIAASIFYPILLNFINTNLGIALIG